MKEIDLLQLAKIFFKNIAIILIFCLITVSIIYLHYTNTDKVFKTQILTKDPSYQEFSSDFFTEIDISFNFVDSGQYSEFVSDFNSLMLSKDNLNLFLTEINSVDLQNRLQVKFIEQTKKEEHEDKFNYNILSKYELFYDADIDGPNILNNYTEYTKIKTIKEFVAKRALVMERMIDVITEALEVADEISQEYPLISAMTGDRNSVVYEPDALYYKGTKVLNKQLLQLKKNLKELRNSSIDYNIILDRAVNGIWINDNKSVYFLASIFICLFWCFIIVFVRLILKNK